MNQYIITEERLQLLYRVTKSLRVLGYTQKANMIEEVTDEVRSRPYQSSRDTVLNEINIKLDFIMSYVLPKSTTAKCNEKIAELRQKAGEQG